MVIVPPVGVKLTELFNCKVPLANEALYCDCAVGVAAMIRPPEKVRAPELEIDEPTADMVMVPLGEKVAEDEMVKAPAMLKALLVVTVALEAIVKP